MCKIIGTGFAVPDTIVRNEDISDNPQWVFDNIGIAERRQGGSTLKLAYEAAWKAMKDAGIKKVDMIIVATATPEKIAPSTAALVAGILNQTCPAFDINAVCSGFLYGLIIAEQLIRSETNILLIGVDTFSKITDYSDRNCVFFGDGAGAVVLTEGDNLKAWCWDCEPSKQGFTCYQGETFVMDGKQVYTTALRLIPEVIKDCLRIAQLEVKDIDYMVPHQPSKRILNDVADKIGFPKERVLMNMEQYANTSAATIPILLHESWDKFKTGDKILFAAIGSGWTCGAAIYEV